MFTCVHLCSLVFTCVPLVFHLRSTCVHLCSLVFTCVPLVFTCVHLCLTCVLLVFTCVHLCSFVFTCVHLCSHLCGVLDQINKFIIPLDFEMLDGAAPYYQAGLGNRLCYKITFNDYNRVIKSTVAASDAMYKITDISLEYEIITQPDPMRSIRSEYQSMALLYDRILSHKKIIVNKSDTVWNWAFNMPCKSLKGILVLFEDEKTFARDTSKYYSPKIQKVSVIVEGKPNQLYAQGMRSFEQYDEIRKYFTEGKLANEVQAQLQLYDVSLGEYLVNKYALWLDFRATDENELHRMGRRIENASEGITLQIEKKEESAGAFNAYIYLIMDAQLNIQSGAYVSAIY